jgi:hypothetical protein
VPHIQRALHALSALPALLVLLALLTILTLPTMLMLSTPVAIAAEVISPTDLDNLYARFRPLLVKELRERQIDDPADLYKFLYQGVMGPAHARVDEEAAFNWLHREWQEIANQAVGEEQACSFPLLVPLRPDSLLVRIHLEPLAGLTTEGLPPEARATRLETTWDQLAKIFSRTAKTWSAEPSQLSGLWERCRADQTLWQEYLDPARLAEFTLEVSQAGWPAVHHGHDYKARWRPHYRVVARDQLPLAWTEPREVPPPGRPELSGVDGK